MIKKKSLIVALVSGFIISSVMILTLIGYVAYLEIKGREEALSYDYALRKIKAKTGWGHSNVNKLDISKK